LIGLCYGNYGIIYHRQKNWGKSAEYFEKNIKIADDTSGLSASAVIYFSYGKILAEKGDWVKAKPQFQNALKCYEKIYEINF